MTTFCEQFIKYLIIIETWHKTHFEDDTKRSNDLILSIDMCIQSDQSQFKQWKNYFSQETIAEGSDTITVEKYNRCYRSITRTSRGLFIMGFMNMLIYAPTMECRI